MSDVQADFWRDEGVEVLAAALNFCASLEVFFGERSRPLEAADFDMNPPEKVVAADEDVVRFYVSVDYF